MFAQINQYVPRNVILSLAAAALAVACFFGGAIEPTAISKASPGHGDTWVDCAGPVLCTKYWSRAKTRDLDGALNGPQLWIAEHLTPRAMCEMVKAARVPALTTAILIGICTPTLAAANQYELNAFRRRRRQGRRPTVVFKLRGAKMGLGPKSGAIRRAGTTAGTHSAASAFLVA